MEVIDKNEYISKIEVVRILQKAYAEGRIQAKDGCTSVLDDIAAIKADVQPARHGRWTYSDIPIFGNPYGRYLCSLCDFAMDERDYNYCPNCGARMDGDAE